MYEYGIEHKHCKKTTVIFGYNITDAFRRSRLDPKLWEVMWSEYAD